MSEVLDAPYSPADLYDAAAYGADPLALHWLQENFEILSRPRERITVPLRRGDVLLRRGEGGLAHACVILDPVFRSGLEISLQGGRVEFNAPGSFVFVAERGARPHDEHERFARRVTDESGRVLSRQFILRPRESEGEGERVDPMSLVVGMTIANMGARPQPVAPVVIAPPPAAPPVWTPPAFEGEFTEVAEVSEFAECHDAAHETVPRIGWTASCHSHVHENCDHSHGEGESEMSAEFNSPEHFRLGSGIQAMVNAWAQRGLVSGGCFVIDSDASTTAEPNGPLKPISQWRYFVPDRTRPERPYGDATGAGLSGANWHWITPNALNDASGRPWTAETLKRAVLDGTALTMSIGDIVMTSGDLVGDFSDYEAASRSGWRGTAINIARGLATEDPFAWAIVRRLNFPRTGTDALGDIHMISRASTEPAAIRAEIRDASNHGWAAVRGLIHFLRRAAGARGYQQLLVLSRLMRNSTTSIDAVRRVAPWLTTADSDAVLNESRSARFSFNSSTNIDSDVFQFIVSNGAYAELALHNERHFSLGGPSPSSGTPPPTNWETFEASHRAALQIVDQLATASGSSSSTEHGPIPANAIARLAHGLHFLTDAFAAGHMRVPRRQLGPNGSLLSGVMHDLENDIGLTVKNDLGQRWRAFGDGHLEWHPATSGNHTTARDTLLAELVTAAARAGHPIESRFDANRTHAMNAVGAAMKQLHYQAQKYFGVAGRSTQYQEILRANRGTATGLAHDEIQSHALPGTGTSRDAWIGMEIPAKIDYMRKHRPVPLPSHRDWRTTGVHNHPPLVYTTASGGSLVTFDSTSYALNQHLASRHALYEMELRNAGGFTSDITRLTLLAALTPTSAISWAGTRETWLPRAIEHWPDHRGWRDAVLRWVTGLSRLHIP